jgi:hypothetical protein
MKLPATLFLLVARGVSVLTGLLLGVAIPAPGSAADYPLTRDGQPAPRWDLARDTVPVDLRHGGTYRDDGTVSLAAGEWFGVPASAFPDQRNFTVQITVSFPEVVDGGHTNVLLKQRPDGEETGFGLSCLHGKPSWARFFRPIINGMHIHDPLGRTQLKFAPDHSLPARPSPIARSRSSPSPAPEASSPIYLSRSSPVQCFSGPAIGGVS